MSRSKVGFFIILIAMLKKTKPLKADRFLSQTKTTMTRKIFAVASLLVLQITMNAQSAWDVPYPDSIFCETGEIVNVDRVFYGDAECQWFFYSRPEGVPSDSLIPLVIFAHGASSPAHSANALQAACFFNSAGYAFLSWESWSLDTEGNNSSAICPEFIQGGVSTNAYTVRTHADFQRVLCYVKSNIEDLHIDSEEIFVTGRSRGTRMSFKDLNTLPSDVDVPCTEPLNIKGVYFFQPIPDGEFKTPNDEDVYDYPNENYPPLALGFNYEPGVFSDAHDAANAIPIVEKYYCLGLEATLREEICLEEEYEPGAIDFFQSLRDPSFAAVYQIDNPTYSLQAPYADDIIVECSEGQDVLRAPQNCEAIVTNGRVRFKCDGSETWFAAYEGEEGESSEPDQIRCEIRGKYSFNPNITDNQLEDRLICVPTQRAKSFSFGDGGQINGPDASFSFPPNGNGYNLCNFNTSQAETGKVIAQIRCRVSPEGLNYSNTRRWWTPWSDVMDATFACATEELIFDDQHSDVSVQELVDSERYNELRIFDFSGRQMGSYVDISSFKMDDALQLLPQGFYILHFISNDGSLETRTIYK